MQGGWWSGQQGPDLLLKKINAPLEDNPITVVLSAFANGDNMFDAIVEILTKQFSDLTHCRVSFAPDFLEHPLTKQILTEQRFVVAKIIGILPPDTAKRWSGFDKTVSRHDRNGQPVRYRCP